MTSKELEAWMAKVDERLDALDRKADAAVKFTNGHEKEIRNLKRDIVRITRDMQNF